MLFAALLAATLSQTAGEEEERDLSFTVELTGGRQLGASGFVDYGVLPNLLYLNGGYTLLKTPALAPTATSPGIPTAPTHIFSGGIDWTPGRHLSLSFLLSGSPRATDQVILNPAQPKLEQVILRTWRSSLGGTLMAGWASGGLSDFEWVIDGALMVTANHLGRGLRTRDLGPAPEEDNMWSYRGLGGVGVTLFDRTDLSLRGGVSAYSADPLTVGRFSDDERKQITDALIAAGNFAQDVETLARAAQQAATRLGQADSLSGYASGPLWVEARLVVRHRFSRVLSAQVGWTYNRYVPTAGYSHILSSKVTVKLGEHWRLWGGAAVQYDEPLDQPSQRKPGDLQRSLSGLATVGVELTI